HFACLHASTLAQSPIPMFLTLSLYLQYAPCLQFLGEGPSRKSPVSSTHLHEESRLKISEILFGFSVTAFLLSSFWAIWWICEDCADGRFSYRFGLGTGSLGASCRAAASAVREVGPERPAEPRGHRLGRLGAAAFGLRPATRYTPSDRKA